MKTLRVIFVGAFLFVIVLWTAGACFYDIGSRLGLGWLWLTLWLLLVVGVLGFVTPKRNAALYVTLAFVGVLVWWLSLSPSHDRDWDPNFSQLPKFVVDGDDIVVHNVRNTRYRTLDDYDCSYETRRYRLSDLQHVDLLILFWGSTAMSHPFIIFDFGDGRHLCFSVEVRYQNGQPYDLFGGLYRQYELMYVVTDERDAILRRSKYAENQDCYLYRYQIDQVTCRRLLLDIMDDSNSIFDQPRWYNAVTSSCTTAIYKLRQDEIDWDWRILFNGSMDEMFYGWGRLYQELPFDELKRRSWINDKANDAKEHDFGRTIREGLPGF